MNDDGSGNLTPNKPNAPTNNNTNGEVKSTQSIGMTGDPSSLTAYHVYSEMCGEAANIGIETLTTVDGALTTGTNLLSDEANLDLTGIFGMPYKFTELADIRGSRDKYGKTYIKTFVEQGNFASFKVGRPNFMPGASNSNTAPIIKNMMSGQSAVQDMMEDIKVGQLFGFEEAMYEYWEMVSLLIRACSIFMGMKDVGFIFDSTTPSWSVVESHWGQYASKYLSNHPSMGQIKTYSEADWVRDIPEEPKDYGILERNSYRVVMDSVQYIWDNTGGVITDTAKDMYKKGIEVVDSIFGSKQKLSLNNVVTFYNDGPVEISEGGSNSVGQSAFKGLLNGSALGQAGAALDIAKELAFLTGAQSHKTFYQYNENYEAEKMYTKSGSMMANVFGGPASFFASNTSIPDVWKDSSYDKSFNVRMKFATPYGNRMSVFKDVIVPLCHVLPLGMPNRGSMSVNSYTSPYILNVLVKGSVNCQMGIVQSIAISKNQETTTIEGLPTDVEVVLNIKDLTSSFALPNTISTKGLLESPGLLSYLATMCGINVDNVETIMYKLASTEGYARIKTLAPTFRQMAFSKMVNIGGAVINKISPLNVRRN